MYSSSEKVVSMTAAVPGTVRLISAAAASPLMPGIRTSRSTTSGR